MLKTSRERIKQLLSLGVEISEGDHRRRDFIDRHWPTRIAALYDGGDIERIYELTDNADKLKSRDPQRQVLIESLKAEGVDVTKSKPREPIYVQLHVLTTPERTYYFLLPHTQYLNK